MSPAKTILPVPAVALSAALLLAALAPPCAGEPLPGAAARTRLIRGLPAAASGPGGPAESRQGDLPAATPAPLFQAIGAAGDMAVVDPAHLLTAALFFTPDNHFGAFLATGLAINAGTTFVVGNDFTGFSWLGQVDFTTGVETTIGSMGYVVNDIAFDNAGHLYGLTDNTSGASPHSLLLINTVMAAATVVKVLNAHGGPDDGGETGAIAFNAADGSFYYADRDSANHLFVDKLAPGTFAQTPAVTTNVNAAPTAMTFAQGRLWLFSFGQVVSADASNLAAGFGSASSIFFPTPDGLFFFFADGVVPNTLPCVPSLTAACLDNRFKVEITYDATPNNGSGPASVVLESTASVKFTFFDPTNIEMILKVLDACSFNQKWWVFAGGLTNVGVSIKVTDTVTGASKTYGSAKNNLFQTFADTTAFNCP